MTALAAGLVGVGLAAGLLLVVAGATGHELIPRPRRLNVEADRALLLGVAGLITTVGVLAVTGWLVPAVAAGVAVWFSPRLLAGTGGQRAETERIEAIAAWCEMVRDTISSGAGLEQALVNSALHAPTPIYPELRRFERRVDHEGLLPALAGLSEDLSHPSADLVIVAVANAARMESRDLTPLLTRLAAYVRDDVRMRQRTDASRARLRLSVQVVVGMTVFSGVVLMVVSPDLVAPYDKWQGQLWLVVVFGVFATGFEVMRRLARFETPERFTLRRSALSGGRRS